MHYSKNFHCKDNKLFEMVQIPLSHLKFPQYITAVNEHGELSRCISVKLYIKYTCYLVESKCRQLLSACSQHNS